jgi:hypothetical protein
VLHQSRVGRVEDGGTLQNREDRGGGSAGLDLAQSRAKEKGAARAAHRRLKDYAATGLGGSGRRLRRPAGEVGAEANQSWGRGWVAPVRVRGEAGGGRSVWRRPTVEDERRR